MSFQRRAALLYVGDPLDIDQFTGNIRLPTVVRKALQANVEQKVEIYPIRAEPIRALTLYSDVDWFKTGEVRKQQVAEEVKKQLIARKALAFKGMSFELKVGLEQVPMQFRIREADVPGLITEETVIELHLDRDHATNNLTFEEVGGLRKEISLLRELVLIPLQYPQCYRRLGIKMPKGIILYGPPGSGKTYLSRAIAGSIEAKFYYINGPDIIGASYGETEATLRKIFSEAQYHAPSIIFIDELDAIAVRRGETGNHRDTRIVTQLLTLLDGMVESQGVIVIGTTNRLDSVDPALRRPGRFDREIYIGPPSPEERFAILSIHTQDMPLDESAENYLHELAEATHGYVGADLVELCREAGLSALRRLLGTDTMLAELEHWSGNARITKDDFVRALETVRPSALREVLSFRPEISWSGIYGLESAKERLSQQINRVFHQSDAESPRKKANGVLLFGPNGTGKSMLAEAAAHFAGVNFIVLKGPEVFSKWLGESEEGIRYAFQLAKRLAPSILFIDQLEAIARKRGTDGGNLSGERVVSQLLLELDDLQKSRKCLVLAATDRKDLIDPAVLRPGRIGLHIHVPLPDKAARKQVILRHLREMDIRMTKAFHRWVDEICEQTEAWSVPEIEAVFEEATDIASPSKKGRRLSGVKQVWARSLLETGG